MTNPIVRVRNLTVRYRTREATVHAVEDVSFDLYPGKVLTLVGESGSGKTTAGIALLRLLPPEAEVLSGQVLLDGEDVMAMDQRDLRTLRGRRLAMVFQDPVAGLNPVLSVGDQVTELLTNHLQIKKKDARHRAIDLLHQVGLADPERVAKAYPFQLSGGMCQRVMIAIATALDPAVLIADEPTSSLDVTIQAQILHQLDQLRHQRGTAILLITHDFGVVAHMADEVAVMYSGRVVESGEAEEVMSRPLHPYTAGLLAARPRLDSEGGQLASIPGHPPEFTEAAEHCPFLPRCTKVVNACRAEPAPPLRRAEDTAEHAVACYNPMWQG